VGGAFVRFERSSGTLGLNLGPRRPMSALLEVAGQADGLALPLVEAIAGT
jgi:hypothetical protein